ncbi:MAG: hypothetical protein LC733_05975 [Actinobacteria bacterium]|nr:hypothetical protein [Actinomycetota bacterium]
MVMGTVMFGVAYGALLSGLDNDSWWVGALGGLAHGLVVGVVFMPMMAVMHPRMSRQLVAAAMAGRPSLSEAVR